MYSLFDERLTETEDRLRDSLALLCARGALARSHGTFVTHAHACDGDLHEILTWFIIILSARPTLSESDDGRKPPNFLKKRVCLCSLWLASDTFLTDHLREYYRVYNERRSLCCEIYRLFWQLETSSTRETVAEKMAVASR